VLMDKLVKWSTVNALVFHPIVMMKLLLKQRVFHYNSRILWLLWMLLLDLMIMNQVWNVLVELLLSVKTSQATQEINYKLVIQWLPFLTSMVIYYVPIVLLIHFLFRRFQKVCIKLNMPVCLLFLLPLITVYTFVLVVLNLVKQF